MSDIPRYRPVANDKYGITDDVDGKLCEYRDYARLKAEVERLRKFNDEALAHIAKEERKSRECLDMAQADVERLIKAGDALILALDKRDDCFDNSDKRQAIADWNAAKEASQA